MIYFHNYYLARKLALKNPSYLLKQTFMSDRSVLDLFFWNAPAYRMTDLPASKNDILRDLLAQFQNIFIVSYY